MMTTSSKMPSSELISPCHHPPQRTVKSLSSGRRKNRPSSPLLHSHTAATGVSSPVVSRPRQKRNGKKRRCHRRHYCMSPIPCQTNRVASFVERFGRHEAEHYLRIQEAYTLHKQVQKRFPCCKMLCKAITDLYRQISSTCRASRTTTRIVTCWPASTSLAREPGRYHCVAKVQGR